MKRTLKESVGVAISHGLAPGTADRIGAFAMAGKLGIVLWEWRYGGLPKADHCENLLTTRTAKRLRVRYVGSQKITYLRIRKTAKQVLREWYSPECQMCVGVKEISGEHKRVVCPSCDGQGVKRYTDTERAEAIGVSLTEYRNEWDKHFRAMRDMVGGDDGMTGAIVRDQLKVA